MKVILMQYHEKLGDVGNLVNVKAGYANNYLIPQNLALIATKGNINQMKLVKNAALKVEAKNIEEADNIVKSLGGLTLKFVVKTGEEGKLYGSITNKDLAEKIMKDKSIEVDRKKIDLREHIKAPGEYDVDIKLYKEIKAGIKVIVEPDKESKALIKAHKKEKQVIEEEEKKELDAGIEVEAEKNKEGPVPGEIEKKTGIDDAVEIEKNKKKSEEDSVKKEK